MKKIFFYLVIIAITACQNSVKSHSKQNEEISHDTIAQLETIDPSAQLILTYDSNQCDVYNLSLYFDKIVYHDSIHVFDKQTITGVYLINMTEVWSNGIDTYIMLPLADVSYALLLYYQGTKLVDSKQIPGSFLYLNDIDEDGVAELVDYTCYDCEPIFVDTIECEVQGNSYYEVYKLNNGSYELDSVLSSKFNQVKFRVVYIDTIIPFYGQEVTLVERRDIDFNHHTLSEYIKLDE